MTKDQSIKNREYWLSIPIEERQRRTKLAHQKYRAKPEKRALEKAWRERPEVKIKMLKNSYEFHRNNLAHRMLLGAKRRAIRFGVPFSIELSDIVVPETCPVLGITLRIGNKPGSKHGGTGFSPTLDRKIPSLGYVKGNVFVISLRANGLKNSATVEELEKIVQYYRG